MERLTSSGTKTLKIGVSQREVEERLAKYEDADEREMLLWLPCSAGTTVYKISAGFTKCSKYGEELDDYNCQGCESDECDSRKEYFVDTVRSASLEWIVKNRFEFGKTIFLSKVDAEDALRKIRRNGGC